MSAKDLQTRAEAWLKARMKRLTPRQRLGLVTVLLLVYATRLKYTVSMQDPKQRQP